MAFSEVRPRRRGGSKVVRLRGYVTATPVVAALALGVGACGTDSAGSSPPDTLTVAMPLEPANLDVQTNSTAVNSPPLVNIYQTLTTLDPKGAVKPLLATSWKSVSPTSWRFTLRSGVKFTNGEPFDATAAVFSIKRALNPASDNIGYYPTITGAQASGSGAVTVTTKTPDPLLPQQLALLPMIAPKYVQQHPKEYLKKAIGTGPYVMESWQPGQQFVIRANPDYWGPKPRYSAVTFKLITDANVRAQAVRTGEVDFAAALDPTTAKQAPKIFAPPSNVVCTLVLNNTSGPFKSTLLRQAANYAINRPAIAKSVFGRFGKVSNGQLVTSASFGYNPSLGDYPYDPAKAKQLVQQSGYSGTPISLIGMSGHWTGDRDMLLAAASDLQAVGIKAKADIVEYSVWRKDIFADPKPAASFLCTSDDGLMGFRALDDLVLPSGAKDAYRNPAMTAKVEAAQSQFDASKRRAQLQQLWGDLKNDAFTVPIAGVDQIYGAGRDIQWNSPVHGNLYVDDIRKGS